MQRYSLLVLLSGLLGTVMLYLPGWSGAAQIPPDKAEITLMPKFGPVHFSHLRHSSDLGVACRDCHHTMTDTDTDTDTVQGCHACHPAKAYRVAAVRPIDEQQAAAQQDPQPASAKQVLHGLCKGCHAERSRQGLPSGPSGSCRDCHK